MQFPFGSDYISACPVANKLLISGCKYYEPRHEKNQQNECAPSEDSDQPGHPPSLIRVFAVRMKNALVFG